MTDILASPSHSVGLAETPTAPAVASHRRLPGLRGLLATWSERMRFRWDLERMLKANPHLVDDIGLTKQEVETEISKRFWRR